ncbi:ABC transporter permease [Corynebacterium variabile]|uniref:ABC transporter permease n=1 Tax=Corynebacterium variabile TaxID=1727 RepID=UPI003FD5FB4F
MSTARAASSAASTMRRVSLCNLAGHKVRLVLTVLAVVLGTAFISGALMFTASLSKTFDTLSESTTKGVDVTVTPDEATGRPLPLEIGDILADAPGVAKVNNSTQTTVVVSHDGTTLQTGGAPAFATAWYPGNDQVGPATTLTDGDAPVGDDQVVVNSSAADKDHISVGDALTVVDTGGVHEVTVSGIYDIDVDGGGFIGLMMEQDAYLSTFTDGRTATGFALAADPGVSQEQLKADVTSGLADAGVNGVEVKTGQQSADEQSDAIDEALSFVNYFLIAFGLVALVVGTFIIANTFSMIVAQRTREFALLRSLGVSSRQLTTSVVGEAVVVGVIGALVGVAAGAGLTKLIYTVIGSTGAGLPDTGVHVTAGSVVTPLILGVLVTVVSAWAPARRAGAVRPVEAMRSGDMSSASSLRGRTVTGAVLLVLGVVAALAGVLFDDSGTGNRAVLVGLGALGVLLGTFLVSAAMAVPVVPAIGRVIGAPFRSVGRLASTSSSRNPRRTATTAFALTLGIALVAVFGMLGASMKASISGLVDNTVSSDLVLYGPSDGSFPIPTQALDAARDVDGVTEVSGFGLAPVTLGGTASDSIVSSGFGSGYFVGDPRVTGEVTEVQGSVDLTGEGFIASESAAQRNGWTIGEEVPLDTAVPGADAREIGTVALLGTYEDNDLLGDQVISWASIAPHMDAGEFGSGMYSQPMLFAAFVDGDIPLDDLRDRLEDVTDQFIVVQVLTPSEFAGTQAVFVDQMLNVLYALLALAVIVAVLGIVNTLALNVIERRQEIGMLRAVGTSRGQVRRMITLEAVQISLYGAVVGVVVGLALGWAFLKVLAGEGLDTIAVPWGQVVGMIVVSGVIGVLAAAWPAVKAARTPPLEAIAD